jgi:hypothetical protein
MRPFMLAAVLAGLVATPLAAQDDRWQITLDGSEYVWDVRLVRLDGDSLVVRQSDSLRPLSVEHISEMRLIRKTEMQLGDAGGTMSALMGTDDEIYDFTPLEFAERIRAIQKILLTRPPESEGS